MSKISSKRLYLIPVLLKALDVLDLDVLDMVQHETPRCHSNDVCIPI
jgi:hypothetical protein